MENVDRVFLNASRLAVLVLVLCSAAIIQARHHVHDHDNHHHHEHEHNDDNNHHECPSFPVTYASCFFALGGGLTPFGGRLPQPQTTSPECIALYEEYFKTGGQYSVDTATAINAGRHLLDTMGNYHQMVIFDIDETTLSNVPLFQATNFRPTAEDEAAWLAQGVVPAIPATLHFYRDLIAREYSVGFITSRVESVRNVTISNLLHQGYGKQCVDVPASPGAICYVHLIMKRDDDHRDSAVYRSEERGKLKATGFNLVASVGDQWSDFLGTDSPPTIIKMPNPVYYYP